MVKGLFSIWQIFESTLAKLECFWAAFQCCTWRILKNNKAIWSHWANVTYGDDVTLSLWPLCAV